MNKLITKDEISDILNNITNLVKSELDNLEETINKRSRMFQNAMNAEVLNLPIVKQVIYEYEDLIKKEKNENEILIFKNDLEQMKTSICELTKLVHSYVTNNNINIQDCHHIKLTIKEVTEDHKDVAILNKYVSLETTRNTDTDDVAKYTLITDKLVNSEYTKEIENNNEISVKPNNCFENTTNVEISKLNSEKTKQNNQPLL